MIIFLLECVSFQDSEFLDVEVLHNHVMKIWAQLKNMENTFASREIKKYKYNLPRKEYL